MTIRIDRVATRGGDKGETSLGDGLRVSKDAARIEALGAVDEANAALGVLRLHTSDDAWLDDVIARAQNDLFDIGADLAVSGEGGERLRITASLAERLDEALDAINQDLSPLTSFVLPGGTSGCAYAHLARTIVRRAERRVVTLAHQEAVNPEITRTLNRLSDLMFVIARRLAKGREHLWKPGG